MKAYRRCEGIAPLILYLGTICRWVVYVTPRLLYPRENRRHSLISRVDGLQRRCGSFREEKHFLALPGIDPRIAQPVTSR